MAYLYKKVILQYSQYYYGCHALLLTVAVSDTDSCFVIGPHLDITGSCKSYYKSFYLRFSQVIIKDGEISANL